MKQKLLLAAILLSLPMFAAGFKLIDLSWWCPTVEYLEQHLEEMQKTVPLDGLTVTMIGKEKNGFAPKFRNAWQNKAWKYEDCKEFVERYNKLDMGRFTDNFLYLTTNDAQFNWFNDNDWKIVAHNFGVAAKVAKNCKMKGLMFDIEQYGIHFWEYDEKKEGKPFAEAAKIAYKRGEQWGSEVFKAYPNIVLFMPYAFRFGNEKDKDKCLANAFLNGMFNVMPRKAILIEGIENKSYGAKSKKQFEDVRAYLDYEIENDVYPKNNLKAKQQLKFSPGLYLDALILKCWGDEFHQPELGQCKNHTEFFCNVVQNAASVAYNYVWLYGEKRSWWPMEHEKYQGLWKDAPGMENLNEELLRIKKLAK